MAQQLEQAIHNDKPTPIIKVPLKFTFPPVELLSKELTKLNSPHPQRIAYLGPRWDNSAHFHKKYANSDSYEFKDRQVSKNNSLIRETMTHNQFYKNELYYRAFEGMNPTLDLTQQLLFESRFESGNLDCVVKVGENEYDLFLRIDSNTRGHLEWFYFSVKNCTKGRTVRLNIANLTKARTHYCRGLHPFMYSSRTHSWAQSGTHDLRFKQKRLRYDFLYDKIPKIGPFYELSFAVTFTGQQQVRFAYCVPYTYSDLLRDIKQVSSVAQVGTLGQSLTGLGIPLVVIGRRTQDVNKPVLVVTGRVHPGESNSSIVLSQFMKFYCFSQEARYLRQKIITFIVPMINPDGVILGNSRCSSAGKDLNRQFRSREKALFPEVHLVKNFMDKLSEVYDLEVYLDFHGHSRKKNMFTFGPSYNITQPQYYKSRVIPKLFSTHIPFFRYYGCSYDIPFDKRCTARAVMISDYDIPFVYTVETSTGFYRDYLAQKDCTFSESRWQQTGPQIVMALKEYYEGVEQYENFIQAKRQMKKILTEDLRSSVGSPKSNTRRPQLAQKEPKDMRMFQLYEQIKQLEDKKAKEERQVKQLKEEDQQSDSHDEKEDLEKQKMGEFNEMVTDYVQEEEKRSHSVFENITPFQRRKGISQAPKRNKQWSKKKRDLRLKEQQMLFSEAISGPRPTSKRFEIKTESKNRRQTRQVLSLGPQKAGDTKQKNSRTVSRAQDERPIQGEGKSQNLSYQQYLDQQVEFISVERKAAKMNVRMFNFSKMVQDPRSLRYQDTREFLLQREMGSSHGATAANSPSYSIKGPDCKTQFNQYSSVYEAKQPQKPYMMIEKTIEEESETYQRLMTRSQHVDKKSISEQMKVAKGKQAFPSSFYRIKYHNNQRRRQENKRQRRWQEQQPEYRQIKHLVQNNLNSLTPSQREYLESEVGEKSKRDGLFIQIKRCGGR